MGSSPTVGAFNASRGHALLLLDERARLARDRGQGARSQHAGALRSATAGRSTPPGCEHCEMHRNTKSNATVCDLRAAPSTPKRVPTSTKTLLLTTHRFCKRFPPGGPRDMVAV